MSNSLPTTLCITQLFGSCYVLQLLSEVQAHTVLETIKALLALLLVNKPALKLPNKSCLSVANSRDSLLKLMDCICTHSLSSRVGAWQWKCIVIHGLVLHPAKIFLKLGKLKFITAFKFSLSHLSCMTQFNSVFMAPIDMTVHPKLLSKLSDCSALYTAQLLVGNTL